MIDFSQYTFLALGSNLGNRKDNIIATLNELRQHMTIIKKSKVYETKPIAGLSQANFYNMVLMVKEDFVPLDLLLCVQSIERKIGRNKQAYWASREIDIDIIFQRNYIVEHVDLKIPHASYRLRDFVLQPLSDIAADYVPFGSEQKISEMLALCGSKNIILEVEL